MAECGSCTGEQASKGDYAEPRFRQISWFALAANVTMFVVEIVASMPRGSGSLLTDALDFLGDSMNYGTTLIVLSFFIQARRKAAFFKGVTTAMFAI